MTEESIIKKYDIEDVDIEKLPSMVCDWIKKEKFTQISQYVSAPTVIQESNPEWGKGITVWFLGWHDKAEFSLCKSPLVDDNFLISCLK